MQNQCPICFDEGEDVTFITFNECNHIFCTQCTASIVLGKSVLCPLDIIEIKNVEYLSIENVTTFESISNYINIVIHRDHEQLTDRIKSNWSNCITSVQILLKRMIIFCQLKQECFNTFMGNNKRIEFSDLLNFNSSIKEYEGECHEILRNISWNFYSDGLVCKFIISKFNEADIPINKINFKMINLKQGLELLKNYFPFKILFC